MKRLFKPMVVSLSMAIPIWILGLYWAFSVKEWEDMHIADGVGIIFILIASGIALWGYRKKNEEELNKKELLILMVLSFAMAIGVLWLSSYGSFIFPSNNEEIILACVNLAVIVLINLISCVAFTYSIKKKRHIRGYLLGIVGMPFIIYMALNILSRTGGELLVIILFILAFYTVVLLIIQVLFILKRDRDVSFFPKEFESVKVKTYYWVSTFIILIILPYIGLSINVSGLMGSSHGIVGNFNHPIFWMMPLINGLAFMILQPKSLGLRKLLFYIKCVGCTFILYFLVSFIPLMPLGFIGIILYGLGLLVFIPTLATLWEVCYIVREVKYLLSIEHKRSCIALLVAGLLTLPILFTWKINLDRENFHIAIDYVTGKEIQAPVNKERLSETIDLIQEATLTNDGLIILNGDVTPILSNLYTRGVIKGKAINFDDINRMRALFFGDKGRLANEETVTLPVGDVGVNLKNVEVSTTYDEKQDIYRSWIDLTIENVSTENNQEYATSITLPDNAYVSDYYLVVGKEKKSGLLADERAATSLYESIVKKSLDPGLLKYLNGEMLELRVFPFRSKEIRQTGFEVIHTGAATLRIDDYTCELEAGNRPFKQDYEVIKEEGVTVLSGDYISTLPKSDSALPRYYFLIDGSRDSDRKVLARRAQSYIEEQGLQETEVWVVEEGILSKGIKEVIAAEIGDGGYNFNGALQQILREEEKGYYPVVIAVTSDFSEALWPYKIQALAQKYPQSSYYYELTSHLDLIPHVLHRGAITYTETTKTPIVSDVRDYEGHQVLNIWRKQFIYTGLIEAFHFTGNVYKDGCLLEAMSHQWQDLSGEKLLEVVKGSFSTRLLTRQTAFIVVETKEQEEELLVLQKKYLSGNIHNSTVLAVSMSEPSLILCVIMLLVYGAYLKKNRENCPGNV